VRRSNREGGHADSRSPTNYRRFKLRRGSGSQQAVPDRREGRLQDGTEAFSAARAPGPTRVGWCSSRSRSAADDEVARPSPRHATAARSTLPCPRDLARLLVGSIATVRTDVRDRSRSDRRVEPERISHPALLRPDRSSAPHRGSGSSSGFGEGIRGLAIRCALAINRASGRRGPVWTHRYHTHVLTTPREVRRAIAYVLLNFRKHLRVEKGIDPRSSGPAFDGWAGAPEGSALYGPVARPRTWLGAIGWRRAGGPITLDEAPSRRPT
jgi:hypothetical protein